MNRYIPSTRTIHSQALGDITRPIVADTQERKITLLLPDQDAAHIAHLLNTGGIQHGDREWYRP